MKPNPDYVTAPRECLVWDLSGMRIITEDDKVDACAARWTCAPITIVDFRFVWWIRLWYRIKNFVLRRPRCVTGLGEQPGLQGWKAIEPGPFMDGDVCEFRPDLMTEDPCRFKPRIIMIGDPLCG